MPLSIDLLQTDHQISLEEAADMTTRYRNELPGIIKPAYEHSDIFPLSETFKKNIFIDLGAQQGCVAIRSYFGMDENQKVRLIFVGVNDNNEDLVDYIFEHGNRCPPICGTAGPLNPQE